LANLRDGSTTIKLRALQHGFAVCYNAVALALFTGRISSVTFDRTALCAAFSELQGVGWD